MKKLFLIILLFLNIDSYSQTRVIQIKDIFYLYNTETITSTSFCDGMTCCTYLKSGADTLCSIYDNGITLWNATIAAGNISDTLSASGITGLCRVTIPTSINTQRVIQLSDFAIVYSTSNYTAFYSNSVTNTNILPITIKNNSDNSVMCIIQGNGIVDWVTTPSMSWMGRIGTTRFKRISLP